MLLHIYYTIYRYRLQPIDLLIRAGTVMVGRHNGVQYGVAERIVHKDFTFESKESDIALIKIEGEFDFSNPLMQPVQLLSEYLAPEKDITTMGWGIYDLEAYEWPQNLQVLYGKSTSNQLCKILQNEVKDAETCFYNEVNAGLCHSDGGSPLVLKGSNLQVGVATYDKNCNRNSSPNKKFTRVSDYVDWIYENTDSWSAKY